MERNQLVTLLAELESLSAQTIENLSELNEDELVAFVDRREDIVNAIIPYGSLITEEDKQLIAHILDDEKEIVLKMYTLKNEAGKWLQNRGTVRIQEHAYHQSFTIDSLFIDYRN